MKVTVLYFAGLSDQAGRRQEIFDLEEGADLETLQQSVFSVHPEFNELANRIRWAVNQNYIRNPKTSLKPGDQIALIPPVSGG